MVQGRLAEKLKLAKLEVLRPSLVLVVRKGSEIQRLTRLVQSATTAPVVEVQSPALVRKKSAVYRRAQRGIRMRRHFESARVVELDLARLQTIDGWLFSGVPIPAATLRTLEQALKTTIPHGEQTADGIFLCLGGRADRTGFNVFHDVFGKKRVTMMPAFFLQNLLVGLIGPDGWLVDVAILQGVNFERALFSLRTPARTLEDVRMLHFGRLRLRTDGSEIAHLRPGDL
jgi:polynucleotide 5'-kinase involved in rRNA processing